MKKKTQIKYNNWSEHLNNTKEIKNYSLRRMDLLIISICGAGIYIVFETLKEIKNNTLIVDNSILLKYAGILFLIAIISNFISQLTGFYANKYEEEYTRIELKSIEDGFSDKQGQSVADKYVYCFNISTNILNIIATVAMFFGLIILSIFTSGLF